jgi:uncharacterized membrane protein HdeD (DUF308 family)
MRQDGDEGRERAERVLGAVGAKLGGLWWAMLARGIIAVVVGFCALVWPSGSIDLLVMLVGVFVLLDGITGLIGALQNGLRGANLLQAIIGIAIGIALLLWPTASVRLLLVVFGVWFLLVGISQFWAARQNQMDGDDRNALSMVGGLIAVLGLVLILWPGTGVVAISWLIAFAALLLGAILIFLALRLRRLQQRAGAMRADRR